MRGVNVVAVVLMSLVARPAAAKSCIRHAYETLTLKATAVYEGERAVPAPAELGELDRLLNSGDTENSALVWNAATMSGAKFYRLERTMKPTPAVANYITARSKRMLHTSCGYSVKYTPVVPGRYVFEQEHSDGSRTPRGIAEPELIVAPGRDVVEIRFRIAEKRYRAVYQVTCASFEWEKDERGKCAPSEQTTDLAAALASAEPIARASDGSSAGTTNAGATNAAAAQPSSAPAGDEPATAASPGPAPSGGSAPPAVSASGDRCAVDPSGSAPWLMWLLALRRRRTALAGRAR